MTKPGAPAEDASRPTPEAAESTQVAAAPTEHTPAAQTTVPPVAKPATTTAPEAKAAPEPNMLSRMRSKVTETLGLDEPERAPRRQEAAPQNSAGGEKNSEQPRVTIGRSTPPPKQALLTAVVPAKPSESWRHTPVTPLATPHLQGVVFTLGTSVKLGQGLGPPESAKVRCVVKNYWKAHFCLEAIAWPERLARIFEINTVLYKGNQVIVRYDEGKATRIYALFPTESFADVAAHFQERFGPPTATPRRAVAQFGAPQQTNPTVQWTTVNPPSQDVDVLEIRTFDDASGVLPNFNLGMIELYRADTPTIFGHLYTSDLMILRRKQSAPRSLSSARKSKSVPAKR
jgi:hypothetical protein